MLENWASYMRKEIDFTGEKFIFFPQILGNRKDATRTNVTRKNLAVANVILTGVYCILLKMIPMKANKQTRVALHLHLLVQFVSVTDKQ